MITGTTTVCINFRLQLFKNFSFNSFRYPFFSRSNTTDPGVGEWGHYGCDAPEVLVLATLAAMQRIEPNPDFILWTGDSGPHYW
jgi:hypothetical protein